MGVVAPHPKAGRLTSKSWTQHDHAELERAVWTLATRQWGVFTVDQLEAVGLSPSAVRSRAAAAKLQRLYRGVYSLIPGELLTAHGRWLAAVYAAGPGAVLSHASSAHLLGLRASDAPLVDV